ncbi:MAG: hypothetical protein BroJett020_17590 [Bacteroidota bacterium]|nr:hypothetical protein [Flavobacteriales bacterium]WKZ76023.1 MAG: hypothetical protein QY303_03825 [Vicingaceae bacterium]GIK70464.1 MAG: hypothetical protein BroJett020_17590 [Bacteroidota bacterium]
MKKTFNVLGVALAVVVYCYTISTLYNRESNTSNKSTLENNKTVAFFSGHFNPVTSQSEGAIQTNCPPLPSIKKPFSKFSLLLKSTDEIIVNAFSQYSFFSKNFLTRFRKVDIIFPFHYFW